MNKKTKRNLMIIGIAISALSLWIANEQLQLDIRSTQASIDYSLDKTNSFFKLNDNTISYDCTNVGEMDGNFYMVLTFTNATFSTQTELPYSQVNYRIVKFPYLAHKDESYENKIVFFNIDSNVEGFSISLTLEKRDLNPLQPNPRYPCSLYYEWNQQLHIFELIERPM